MLKQLKLFKVFGADDHYLGLVNDFLRRDDIHVEDVDTRPYGDYGYCIIAVTYVPLQKAGAC